MKIIDVLIVCLILVGCSVTNSMPSDTVKNFTRYIDSGEVNDACSLVTEEGQNLLSKFGGCLSVLTTTTKKWQAKGGIKTVEILNEEITGNTATVQYKLVFGNDSIKNDVDYLIKDNGKWKIVTKQQKHRIERRHSLKDS